MISSLPAAALRATAGSSPMRLYAIAQTSKGRQAGRQAGWLADWLAGWLAVWLYEIKCRRGRGRHGTWYFPGGLPNGRPLDKYSSLWRIFVAEAHAEAPPGLAGLGLAYVASHTEIELKPSETCVCHNSICLRLALLCRCRH